MTVEEPVTPYEHEKTVSRQQPIPVERLRKAARLLLHYLICEEQKTGNDASNCGHEAGIVINTFILNPADNSVPPFITQRFGAAAAEFTLIYRLLLASPTKAG